MSIHTYYSVFGCDSAAILYKYRYTFILHFHLKLLTKPAPEQSYTHL